MTSQKHSCQNTLYSSQIKPRGLVRKRIYEAMTQIRMHRTLSLGESGICTWRVENESHSAKLWAPPRRQWKRARQAQRGDEAGRQAGAKPWRGAFCYNDSHLPLTGLGKVKLIMTAHGCWIAFDEVNHSQSNKQVLSDFYLPWNYRIFFLYTPTTEGDNLSEIIAVIYMIRAIFVKVSKGHELSTKVVIDGS